MMAPSGKTAPGKASPAAAAPTSRPYATSGAELNRPYVPGETAAEQKQAAEGWRWILLAALGVAAVLGYTKVWPAAQHFLYRPSPARDYLLPPSPEPVYVIAGVGVGWFWILFIAAPVVGRGPGRAVVGDAVLVESPRAHRTHGARAARTAMDRRAVPHRAADPGRRRSPAGGRRGAAAVGIAGSGAPARPAARRGAARCGGVRVLAVRPVGLRPRFDHPPTEQGHVPGLAGAGLAGSARRPRARAAVFPSARSVGVPEGGQAALRPASALGR